ncbi:uncharacterized protein LOC111332217 [Stylophora pistillata]|uniref:uncharacterized protein LOC111332217 n=1 Tax=Stylophora pistillata TaxID=50429 RepID=UPI000C03CF09|nr:uncharacterized protein LOC111332217 [Stylophora pistillata]
MNSAAGKTQMVTFVLLWGILLVQTSTAQNGNSNQNEISFDDFCRDFNELRTSTSMSAVIRDLDSVREQLVAMGVLPERGAVDAVKKICLDKSKQFNPECLYRFRFLKTVDSSDFNRLRDTNLRGLYVDLWLLHPMLRGCLPSLNKDVKSNNVKGRMAAGLLGNNPEQFTDIFDERKGRLLREEIKVACEKKQGDVTFCSSLPELVKLVDTFQEVKRKSRTSVEWNAFLLQFVMLKHNSPDEFETVFPETVTELNDILVKNLEQIFKFISSGQITELNEMMAFVPGLETIKSGCDTSWDLPSITKKSECMFWKAIVQVDVYLQSLRPPAKGNVQKLLNTNIDYPTFLSLTEMDRILEIVQNQETAMTKLVEWLNTELTKTINDRFKGLRTYFQKVETFNKVKAKADVDFINQRVSKYNSEIVSLSTQLGDKFNEILKLAIAAVALEIAEDTIQVGLAAAVVMNPLEKLFGGSSLGDFMDRSAKLGKSLTESGKVARLAKSFNTLKDNTVSISSRFQNNTGVLEQIRVLITDAGNEKYSADFETQKQKFLADYAAYDPKVEKPELTGMTSTWENIVDDACEVILSKETLLAQTIVAKVKSSGLCFKTKVLAQEMIATYEEVYDFQFELIEAMATYMRSVTSLNAAASITAGYEEGSNENEQGESVVQSLKVLTVVSFISYKTNLWQIIESYCDILEYKGGGVRPSVCQGINTNIANLVSHVSQTCRDVEAYKNVPITSSSATNGLDITNLYAGKRLTFKIPNGRWLVDNHWINERDEGSAIFMKKFEVFVPTQSVTERMVRVEARSSGKNQLTPPNGKNYVIVPEKNFVFEYLEGADACRKESEALTNPYGSDKPKLCPLNVDENNCQEILQKTALFPSVYSQWHISLSGYETATVPDPTTVVNLKVGVKLCILHRSRISKKMKVKKLRDKVRKKLRRAKKDY